MKKSDEAAAQNAQTRSLENGRVYTGRVAQFSGGRTKVYSVQVGGMNSLLRNCKYATSYIAGMLGVNGEFTLPEGTPVAVVPGSPNLIIAAYLDQPGDPNTRKIHSVTTERGTRTNLNAYDPDVDPGTPVRDGGDLPSDLLPGELDLTNLFGVGLQMLFGFSKLVAGEHAKVEAHLYNDMVRIVDRVFRHHSAIGDQEIYDDGRLNEETHQTSYPHEVFGINSPTERKLKADITGVPAVEDVLDHARWRFSEYKGFLGGFINRFVTDPVAVMAESGSQAMRSGKFREYVGNDGTMLVQSVSEIAFERVHRIPVPYRNKRHEDPTGVKAADFENLEQDFLTLWSQPKNSLDMYQTCFQLREYARYLAQFQSMARFHQLAKKGEFTVPSESDTPTPEWTSKEVDAETANKTSPRSHFDVYATIRIMKDGSILIWDGTGGGSVYSHGNIYHSATRNMRLTAGGDISVEAGQNIYMKARRSVELSAVFGGIRMKARAFFHMLCELGTLWLKSDASDPSAKGFQTPAVTNTEEDPEVILNDAAILLETSRGRMTFDSKRTLMLAVSGAPDDNGPNDISGSVIIQSTLGGIITHAKTGMAFTVSEGWMLLKSQARSIVMQAANVFAEVRQSFRVGKGFDVTGGEVRARRGRFRSLSAVGSILTRSGHVSKIPEDQLVNYDPTPAQNDKLTEDTDVTGQVSMTPVKLFPVLGNLSFRFDTFASYVPDDDIFMESLAQQFVRLDIPNTLWTGQWGFTNPESEKLLQADNVSVSAPFPGSGANCKQHTGGESLFLPSSKSGRALNVNTELKKAKYQFAYLKRGSKYRV